MLHYSCDLCKRPIDVPAEMRHVVKIEVFAAADDESLRQDGDDDTLGDADHLDDMQDLLASIDDDPGDDDPDDSTHTLRFDLCPECRRRFLRNPLGTRSGKKLDFSNN